MLHIKILQYILFIIIDDCNILTICNKHNYGKQFTYQAALNFIIFNYFNQLANIIEDVLSYFNLIFVVILVLRIDLWFPLFFFLHKYFTPFPIFLTWNIISFLLNRVRVFFVFIFFYLSSQYDFKYSDDILHINQIIYHV